MTFVQLVRRAFDDLKRPHGAQPVFEFDLLPNERIVGVFHYWTTDEARRKTVDHHIIVWVAVEL